MNALLDRALVGCAGLGPGWDAPPPSLPELDDEGGRLWRGLQQGEYDAVLAEPLALRLLARPAVELDATAEAAERRRGARSREVTTKRAA